MEYFQLLKLQKEPFSCSPNPDFFYRSREYEECLQKLEISIRLRRGLNIIFGDVGTGKTTLSRILLQSFEDEKDKFLFHLIIDPSFDSEREFLSTLAKLFKINPPQRPTMVVYKDLLQHYLFQKGVEEGKTIVLLIDEGQKLTDEAIEILRELLNFETNEYKLLQLIVFAQLELWDRIKGYKNFLDRVNMTYTLKPLGYEDTRRMIRFRLSRAGMKTDCTLFTEKAIKQIYRYSKGYPRKIITLCHHALLSALIKHKDEVDEKIVKLAYNKRDEEIPKRRTNVFLGARPAWIGLSLFVGVPLGFALHLYGDILWGKIFPPEPPSSTKKALTIIKKIKRTKEKSIRAHEPMEVDISNPLIGVSRSRSIPDNGIHDSIKPGTKTLLSNPEGKQEPLSPSVDHSVYLPQKYQDAPKEELAQVIIVKKGDTLSQLASHVYGAYFKKEVFQEILKANPHLSDPDNIKIGQKVIFPHLPSNTHRLSERFYSIHVASFRSFANAYRSIEQLIKDGKQVFIIRVEFNDGTQWYRVMTGYFTEKKSAVETAARMKEGRFKYARSMLLDATKSNFVYIEPDEIETRGVNREKG